MSDVQLEAWLQWQRMVASAGLPSTDMGPDEVPERKIFLPNDGKTITLDALNQIRHGLFDRRSVRSYVEVEVQRLGGKQRDVDLIMAAIKKQVR